MFFEVITPARSKKSFLLEGEREFIKRIKRFAKIEIIESDQKLKAANAAELLQREGELLLARARKGALVIALDENGKSISSEGLAELMSAEFNNGYSAVSFLIGGPFGLSDEVRSKANHCISLSRLTFTAQFARLLIVEQIYRSITLMKGIPYHKE